MTLFALILILLPHQGYWFGGQKQEVRVQWAASPSPDAVDISWTLMAGKVRLDGGMVPMSADDKGTAIQLTPPEVRTRLDVSFVYHLQAHQGGKDLGGGTIAAQLFPSHLLSGMAQRLEKKKVAVWDSSGTLAGVLGNAGVKFTRINASAGLVSTRYDIILVADESLLSPFAQQPLAEQARGGASVFVTGGRVYDATLFGYTLTRRKMPARIQWRADHPLFAGFRPADLESWLQGSSEVWALDLPVDEPVLEIASWPREMPGKGPVPIDALLATKSVGAGRLVLCQLPLGDWRTDPRSQMLLSNVMDYLATRPEPTLRPSERPATQPARPRPEANRITIPGE